MPAPTAALVAAMMAWVSSITGLPPAPLPQIVVTADGPGHTRLVHYASGGQARIGAMTLPGTIYLPPGWDATDAADDCLLAHEIVHLVQFASGRRYRCTAAMEPLAWAVEGYCLHLHGLDIYRLKNTLPISVASAAEDCG